MEEGVRGGLRAATERTLAESMCEARVVEGESRSGPCVLIGDARCELDAVFNPYGERHMSRQTVIRAAALLIAAAANMEDDEVTT